VELFEQIRREYDYGVGTIKGVARKLGIHRRMVREALGDAVPRERKINTRGKPRIEPAKAFIEAILQGDENAPRKQRHTAHRIWSRIREELPEVGVAESSIRRYVRERKVELKLIKHETFIPQSYVWGQEAQQPEKHGDGVSPVPHIPRRPRALPAHGKQGSAGRGDIELGQPLLDCRERGGVQQRRHLGQGRG
jgi:hypothetical protein